MKGIAAARRICERRDHEDIASRAILRTLRPLRADRRHQRGHLPAPSTDPDDEARRQRGVGVPAGAPRRHLVRRIRAAEESEAGKSAAGEMIDTLALDRPITMIGEGRQMRPRPPRRGWLTLWLRALTAQCPSTRAALWNYPSIDRPPVVRLPASRASRFRTMANASQAMNAEEKREQEIRPACCGHKPTPALFQIHKFRASRNDGNAYTARRTLRGSPRPPRSSHMSI